MKKHAFFAQALVVAVLTLVSSAQSFASKSGAPAGAAVLQKIKPGVVKMNIAGKNTTVSKAVAGPNHGGSCATPNRTTSRTSHRGASLECSVGDMKTTCTCDLSCDYVCENYVASETCTPSNCSFASGGTGSVEGTGGAATTQPSH